MNDVIPNRRFEVLDWDQHGVLYMDGLKSDFAFWPDYHRNPEYFSLDNWHQVQTPAGQEWRNKKTGKPPSIATKKVSAYDHDGVFFSENGRGGFKFWHDFSENRAAYHFDDAHFTGDKADALGRMYHWVDGKRVAKTGDPTQPRTGGASPQQPMETGGRGSAQAGQAGGANGGAGPAGGGHQGKAPPSGPLPALHEKAIAAIQDCAATGEDHQHEAIAHLVKTLRGPDGQPFTAEHIEKQLQEAFDKAEFTINFRGEQKLPGIGTFADGLTKDKKLKNVFEIGRSGVSQNLNVDAYKQTRTEWETGKLSKHAADVPNQDRPKYAAVNWSGQPQADASHYGDGVFVLNKEAFKGRISLTPANSSQTRPDETASAGSPMNALARNNMALWRAGLSDGQTPGLKPPNYYTELQLWGPVPLNKDTIKEIRLKKAGFLQFGLKAANRKMEAFAQESGIPIKYY